MEPRPADTPSTPGSLAIAHAINAYLQWAHRPSNIRFRQACRWVAAPDYGFARSLQRFEPDALDRLVATAAEVDAAISTTLRSQVRSLRALHHPPRAEPTRTTAFDLAPASPFERVLTRAH